MNTGTRFLCITCTVMFLCAACSAGNGSSEPDNPVVPKLAVHSDVSTQGRSLVGFWTIRIFDDLSYEIVPNRSAEMHLNATHLIETACSNCLLINEIHLLPEKQVSALMVLYHPYPGLLNYTAFDVRGIFITGAGYEFPESEKFIAWGDDVPRLLTYDGYTNLFNPTDFPETYPPALGYIPGHKATGGDLSATLNPYLGFATKPQRTIFMPGEMAYSYMQAYVPEHPVEFGYAIDACWQLVDEPVTDPASQFPPDANALEAYSVRVQVGDGIEAGGGYATITATVSDHQGDDTIVSVTAEAPDLFDGTIDLTYTDSEGGGANYSGTIENSKHAVHGEFPVLVRVIDNDLDQNFDQVDAWQVYVVQIKKGWVRTWGGGMDDIAYGVATGPTDTIITTGRWGDGSFLRSFTPAGEHQWSTTIGLGSGFGVAADSYGRIFVTGFHFSIDIGDIFLSVYDSSGNLLDHVTFGSPLNDVGYGIALDDDGGIYITGFFQGTIDFFPGAGEDLHSSNGSTDAYLVKFDSNGAFQWARTWGGFSLDCGQSVATDHLGRIYVTGYFRNTVDFNTGPGELNLTSAGNYDAFLSVFDSDGTFLRAYRWGASNGDIGDEVITDESGNVYIVGIFRGSADLDPTSGMDLHVAHGMADAFVIKLDPYGAFKWARSWGGVSTDYPLCVAVDNSSGVYISGKYYWHTDFNPGLWTEPHTSFGLHDAFLAKYNFSGEYQWARTWGGIEDDWASGVTVDSLGNAYVAGHFSWFVDFDAGEGFEFHTAVGMKDAYLCKYPPDGNW